MNQLSPGWEASIDEVVVPAPRLPHAGPVHTSITTDSDPATLVEWDELVKAAPGSDVAQLSGWARLRATVGYRSLHLRCRRDGVLVAGAQVLYRHVPVLGGVGYLSYGPVVRPGSADDELWDALAAGLAEIGRRHLSVLFVQPGLDAEPLGARLLGRGFRPSSADLAPAVSLRLDLRLDEAALAAAASKRWRTWKKRWPQRGVTVRVGDETDLGLLAELLARSAGHHGYQPMSPEYLRRLYRELQADGAVRLLIGEVDGQPVAAQLFTGCGGVLKARFIGMDRDSSAASRKVPGALIWSAISWARENGYAWFDWSGIGRATAETLLAGETPDWDLLPGNDRFKVSFGGSAVRYPQAVEIIGSRVVRHTYDACRTSTSGRALVGRITRVMRGGSTHRTNRVGR